MRHEQIVARIDAIKAQWRAVAGELEALIAQSGVDKRSYSSKHLPNWLNKVGEWSGQETGTTSCRRNWINFASRCCWRRPRKASRRGMRCSRRSTSCSMNP
ncbi:hypothetical protein M5585_08530 [Serratia ureilytica]